MPTTTSRSDLTRDQLWRALAELLPRLEKPRRRAVAADAGWRRGESLAAFLDRLHTHQLRMLLDVVLDAWSAQRAGANAVEVVA